MAKETIADSPYGVLEYENGELQNDTKVDDPTAYTVGSRQRSIGMFRADHVRDDGGRESLVTDLYKRDERHYASGDPLVGEFTRHLRAPGQRDASTLIETVRFDGVTYHVPIIAAAGISGAAVPKKIALRAVANGLLVCAQEAGSQPLIANRTAVGPWETFEVVQIE